MPSWPRFWKFSKQKRRKSLDIKADPPSNAEADKQPPLWAVIIGINDYKSPKMSKLSGSVSDADAMARYLECRLNVPTKQIVRLRNEQATRKGIIAAFTKLRDNPRIKHQDAILIYYAGHGGEVSTGKTSDKIQTLIPVDYDPAKILPIPDRTVAALLDGVANRHGNNITVILDCCHSGSGTRGASDVRCGKLGPDDAPDDLDADIIRDPKNQSSSGTRSMRQAKGFAYKGINSHVLLAACSAGELARENSDRREGQSSGKFTAALLDMLQDEGVSPDQITYSEVLAKMPRIEGQNPQCEGQQKNRILFGAKIRLPTHRSHEVEIDQGRYTLKAGSAHGISHGAKFTLYKNKEDVPGSPLCVAVAHDSGIKFFTTTLELIGDSPVVFDGHGIAIQATAGDLGNLGIHVPPTSPYVSVFEAATNAMKNDTTDPYNFSLVGEKDAKLGIVTVSDKVKFLALDQLGRDYSFTSPHAIEPNVDDLVPVLRGAAHYHLHLSNNCGNAVIKDKIEIKFFPLKTKHDKEQGEVYFPNGENLYDRQKGVIDYEVDEGTKYGISITNNAPLNLHFACFFFDHADFSITTLTDDNHQVVHVKDHSLPENSEAEIGYGKRGIPPFECDVPEGLNLTLGFLKFYFMTESINLSHIPQVSPFEKTRGVKRLKKVQNPAWATILIPVIQRRARA